MISVSRILFHIKNHKDVLLQIADLSRSENYKDSLSSAVHVLNNISEHSVLLNIKIGFYLPNDSIAGPEDHCTKK